VLDKRRVAQFRRRYADSPLTDRLRVAWLTELARRKDWKAYRDQYEPRPEIELQCHYLNALLRTGAKDEAFAQTAELWRAPRSQPAACDPVFDAWIAAGNLTQALIWDRLLLALDGGETALARYLRSLLKEDLGTDAATLLRLSARPRELTSASVSRDPERAVAIVCHVVRRLAREDAAAASELWKRLSGDLHASETIARRMAQDLTIARARAGDLDLDADLSASADGRHVDVADALLQAGITTEQWPAVERWVRGLDADERMKPRWRYWLARSLRARAPVDTEQEVDEIYGSLARERQYYGFLAATEIGAAPMLNDRPSTPNEALIAQLRARPVIDRVGELFAVKSPGDARMEWQELDKTLDTEHRIAAAHLAAAYGWTMQSVMAANAAELTNDLELRFPAPFRETFVAASQTSNVPLSFLYAIARQESIFDPAARSAPGALGVMQLMPGTAIATARKFSLRAPTPDRLLYADINIDIGSRHVAELMEKYDNNRVLVAAAYNAGQTPVDRWLAARPPHPIDVWIEAIPYRETRNYVQNVISFAYVYGQRLNAPTPFLTDAER
jgi:soluble lytic murein transglycosylase